MLIALFAIGTCASLTSAISLLFPGSFLEPIWRANPRAHEAFSHFTGWAIVLMGIVCIACLSTVIGLWKQRWWGYWLAVLMLISNLIGDLINVISGAERRAIIGVPVALLILVYLLRRNIRDRFRRIN